MASRVLRPRSWPLAVKIGGDLLLASLIPLVVAVVLTSARGNRQLDTEARENLGLLAGVTAAQLDQLILDTRRLVEQASRDSQIERFCAGDAAARDALRADVSRRLNTIVDSNPDFASIFVTDGAGIGIAATSATNMGMDFNFREYYKQARAGKSNVSELLVGKTSSRPGIYFAAPVRAPASAPSASEEIAGTIVLKLQGERVLEVINSVRIGQRGHALLSDADGVIIGAKNEAVLYHSFGPVDPARIREIDPDKTWGRPTIESLGIPELMRDRAARTEKQGTVSFKGTEAFAENGAGRWIAGYCWMGERDWLVSVVEPESDFAQPMSALVREQTVIVIVVAALAGALAVWRARGIVRPLRAVSEAARRLSEGDFSARAEQTSEDEIGQLAGAFNEMVPQLKERVDLQQSLDVAMEVQKSLLPAADPTRAMLDIAGRSTYCDATGGDYYDFLDIAKISSDETMIAVGDVMGHGVASALLMATARAALRAHASQETNLAPLMIKVNKVLAADARHNRFMTMALLVLDPTHGTARYASAGHDPTIVYHPATDSFDEMEGGGVPLGMIEDETYEQYSYAGLRKGDVLVIGTDGIWEMANDAGEMFGKDRLRELVRRNHTRPAREIAETLEQELRSYRGAAGVQDDVTFVVVRVMGEGEGKGQEG